MKDLPPGVTLDQIPGNRPHDRYWYRVVPYLSDSHVRLIDENEHLFEGVNSIINRCYHDYKSHQQAAREVEQYIKSMTKRKE